MKNSKLTTIAIYGALAITSFCLFFFLGDWGKFFSGFTASLLFFGIIGKQYVEKKIL